MAHPPYQNILDGRAWADLNGRCRFAVRGADAARYLNGQLTNHVAALDETFLQHHLVLNAKGKLEGELFLARQGDVFYADSDGELRETLPARLDRYIVADDVELEDVTLQTLHFHLFHPDPGPPPDGVMTRRSFRFGAEGTDLRAPADQEKELRGWLEERGHQVDADALEAFRLEAGIPKWGLELTPEVLPPEAGLEERAIDYEKGCYIGQEVISRIRSVGKVNRRLRGLVSDRPLTPGQPLFGVTPEGESRKIGVVCSSGHSFKLDKPLALGYVRVPWDQPGTVVTAGEGPDETPVEVKALPILML